MKKLTVLVEISVADNVAELYPNYNANYDDEEQFIDSIINELESIDEINGLPFDHFKQYGYSIRVLSRNEAKLIDL